MTQICVAVRAMEVGFDARLRPQLLSADPRVAGTGVVGSRFVASPDDRRRSAFQSTTGARDAWSISVAAGDESQKGLLVVNGAALECPESHEKC